MGVTERHYVLLSTMLLFLFQSTWQFWRFDGEKAKARPGVLLKALVFPATANIDTPRIARLGHFGKASFLLTSSFYGFAKHADFSINQTFCTHYITRLGWT